MEDLEAVLGTIGRRRAVDPAGLLVFWLRVAGSRRAFEEEVIANRGADAIVPVVVRGTLFRHANALLDDLSELVAGNRRAFENIPSHPGPCAILLLAHEELRLPQISSPAVFPDWFPGVGGREVSVTIEDLTWRAAARLDATVVRAEEVASGLLHLETALLRRLEASRSRNHNNVNAFFDLIRRDRRAPSSGSISGEPAAPGSDALAHGKESFEDFIAGAHSNLDGQRESAGAFRPSARNGRSLTARIWQLVRASKPDELNGRARALSQALALAEPATRRPHESLFAVLGRPTEQQTTPDVRIARNMLYVIYAACQLLTAVHHAGEYGDYPLPLMRTVSLDIREALSTSEDFLSTLSQ